MRIYLFLDRLGWPGSYLGKILLVSFIGVHIPLIGAVGYLILGSDRPLGEATTILLVLLAATLVGTGATLAVLYALLAPVREASRAINGYLREKKVPALPTQTRDEAGLLMANVQEGVTRLDAALDASRAQLEQVEREAKGKFTLFSSMSHELRTPLNHIIGFAEMMATEALGPIGQKAYRGYADDIGSSGGQLLSILQTMLDLSEVAAGDTGLEPAAIPLAEQVREAVGLTHLDAQAAGVAVRAGIPADPTVHIDPRAFKQVMLHALRALIGTAGAGRTVTVVGHAQAGTAVIEIAHDGAPWQADDIPPEMRDQLPGAPAYSSAQEGAGAIRSSSPLALRLSLIRSLLQASGGSLAIRGGDKSGRVMRLVLPAVAGVQVAKAA